MSATLSFNPWPVSLSMARLRQARAIAQARGVVEELSDVELMRRIADGDAAAFRQLSAAHLGAIVTYATRLMKSQAEGEEIAQETFLRAWQHAERYRDKAKVSTWLHRIAHNLAIDRLRNRGVRGEATELDDERDGAPGSQGPSRLVERKAEALTVQHALASLPDRQREAIVLCHEQGMSNPEIAEVMDCGVEAVESLLARGRRKLRQLLEHQKEPA